MIDKNMKYPTSNLRKKFEKQARRKTGFPLATIAYYGPDDEFASKVAVGIILTRSGDVDFLKRWFSETDDIRMDAEINHAIFEFIDMYQVHRIVMMERIIGCPHEEGVDYPFGEKCPQCPFWSNRDRWTGEILNP